MRVDKTRTDDVVSELLVHGVFLTFQPGLHMLWLADFQDHAVPHQNSRSSGHGRVHGDDRAGFEQGEHEAFLSGVRQASDRHLFLPA